MKSNCNIIKFLYPLIFILVFTSFKGYAQSYGLGFSAHDLVADQRTSLDLFPDAPAKLSGKFQLSFEMAFQPNQTDYFGYIFRIVENDTRNIDLIYTRRNFAPDTPGEDPNHFKLIIGERLSKINFNIPPTRMLKQWNTFILEFDTENHQLTGYVNNQKYTETGVKFDKGSTYRLLFGVNNYLHFKTKDATAVKIRNIKIAVNGETKYLWPLNEAEGNIAQEVIGGANGNVSNASWIRAQHRNWQKAQTFSVKGTASVAFNQQDKLLYVVGSDSLYSYSLTQQTKKATGYNSGPLKLPSSNQSMYSESNHILYNYYLDRNNKTTASFDFRTRKWDKVYDYFPIIDYWHSNSFISSADSALYVLGGYGQLTYKNQIHRYDLVKKKWEEVTAKGDFYSPRYLASGGITKDGRSAYILGGYGSKTGTQILNPKNIYDLLKFDIKTKTFKKIYELTVSEKDFVFANSMIIDEKAQTFIALCFSNHVYNSTLKLLVGSLQNPSYQIINSSIPYAFHDTQSFANLYYSPLSNQLLAVTLLRVETNTRVNIYTLTSPPDVTPLTAINLHTGFKNTVVYIAVTLLLLVLLAIYLFRKKPAGTVAAAERNIPISRAQQPIAEVPVQNLHPAPGINKTTILLFGDLKLYDAKGNDLTGQYTSLVKELLLVIMIYTLKSGRGISPEKLIELLWGHKTSESAKNNRATNLSKLRSLLTQMEHLQLSKETGSWKMEIDKDQVYIDYSRYLEITSKKDFTKDKIIDLIEITQRGSFVQSSDYPWLDHIKSEISNEAIDICLDYAGKIKIEDDPEFLIRLAGCVFNFDKVNEEAMAIKCKALVHLGKHSLANSAYVAFRKEYMALYGEEFKTAYQTILERD